MSKEKNVLTNGDVAKICNVSLRTAQKWFDSGVLKGYKLPCSADRRVKIEDLIEFMDENGIPGHDWLKEWQQERNSDRVVDV